MSIPEIPEIGDRYGSHGRVWQYTEAGWIQIEPRPLPKPLPMDPPGRTAQKWVYIVDSGPEMPT